MTGPGGKALEHRSVSSDTGGADTPLHARSEASGAKHPNASPAIDAAGRLHHPCSHPGCGREGCYGQGGDILKAYAKASDKQDAARWLGRWWCREHVPPSFLAQPQVTASEPQAAERREEPPRRQVINGQGVLL
ncbi:hypothetical protein [Oleispirillum naphthae]|uniref:hypothetical protein n=1 Tax=Oleispirillum naphthae TaxID=2838853 RepID=UPI0030824B31